MLVSREVEEENEETGRIFWTTEWKASEDGSWGIGKTEERVDVAKTIGDVGNDGKVLVKGGRLKGNGENLMSGSCLTMPR